jgi:hypothetical protein
MEWSSTASDPPGRPTPAHRTVTVLTPINAKMADLEVDGGGTGAVVSAYLPRSKYLRIQNTSVEISEHGQFVERNLAGETEGPVPLCLPQIRPDLA